MIQPMVPTDNQRRAHKRAIETVATPLEGAYWQMTLE